MNRRSPAVMLNPAPTGAVWAWTLGVKIGVPMPDVSIATSVTIDHDFAERMRRHVRGLLALIIGSSVSTAIAEWPEVRVTFPTFNSSVLSRTCRRRTGGAPADDVRASPSDRDAAPDCGNVLGVTEAGREASDRPTRRRTARRVPRRSEPRSGRDCLRVTIRQGDGSRRHPRCRYRCCRLVNSEDDARNCRPSTTGDLDQGNLEGDLGKTGA